MQIQITFPSPLQYTLRHPFFSLRNDNKTGKNKKRQKDSETFCFIVQNMNKVLHDIEKRCSYLIQFIKQQSQRNTSQIASHFTFRPFILASRKTHAPNFTNSFRSNLQNYVIVARYFRLLH